MELNAEDIAAFDDRGECFAVRRCRDAGVGHRRGIRVCEVDMGMRFQTREDSSGASEIEGIPADVRNFQTQIGIAAQPGDTSFEHAKARDFWRLVASLEEPLHPCLLYTSDAAD